MDSWATRRDVIKYVANNASGVHSYAPKDNIDTVLTNARNCVTLNRNNKNDINTTLHIGQMLNPTSEFVYDKNTTDVVLFELICAIHFFITSPDVLRLCEEIKKELSI